MTAYNDVEQRKPLDMEPGDEGILKGLVGRQSWQFAWARAIAKAWQNDEYKSLLLSDSKVALKEFGFNTPPGLTITIREYDGSKQYNPQPHKNGWIDMVEELAGEVIMILPPRPDDDQQALALADYNATGVTYPFTT